MRCEPRQGIDPAADIRDLWVGRVLAERILAGATFLELRLECAAAEG